MSLTTDQRKILDPKEFQIPANMESLQRNAAAAAMLELTSLTNRQDEIQPQQASQEQYVQQVERTVSPEATASQIELTEEVSPGFTYLDAETALYDARFEAKATINERAPIIAPQELCIFVESVGKQLAAQRANAVARQDPEFIGPVRRK